MSRSTLLERLEQVLASGKLSGGREWGRKAGVAESYVSVLMGRLRANPAADVSRDAIVKLAAAAGVSVAWLFGDIDEPDADPTQPDPELEAALAARRYPRAVVAAARELTFPPWSRPDWPKVLSWLDVAIRVATSIEE